LTINLRKATQHKTPTPLGRLQWRHVHTQQSSMPRHGRRHFVRATCQPPVRRCYGSPGLHLGVLWVQRRCSARDGICRSPSDRL